MSLSEPKRNASVNSKPLHRVCKLEFLVFLEFNLRDLKLRVITVFYPLLAPIFLTCFWLQNQWNESLSWHLKNVLKKCIQHMLSRQFSHIKLVVVGFFLWSCEEVNFLSIFWNTLQSRQKLFHSRPENFKKSRQKNSWNQIN